MSILNDDRSRWRETGLASAPNQGARRRAAEIRDLRDDDARDVSQHGCDANRAGERRETREGSRRQRLSAREQAGWQEVAPYIGADSIGDNSAANGGATAVGAATVSGRTSRSPSENASHAHLCVDLAGHWVIQCARWKISAAEELNAIWPDIGHDEAVLRVALTQCGYAHCEIATSNPM